MNAANGEVLSLLLEANGSWPLYAAATRFARAGIPVFPCSPNGKRPITRQGLHDATTNLDQIAAWWDRVPNANIGMPTGQPSGVVVVDVDIHGATNGYPGFNRAHRAGLVTGWEFLARTPSGGMHVYFPAGGVEQRSWQAGRAGIDFRGDGGYIVVPPSSRIIDGHRAHYTVEHINQSTATPVDAQRLRDFLDPKPTFRPPESRPIQASADASALAERVARLQEGERNLGLFKAACRLAESGTPPGEALSVLGSAAGQAGLGEREITRTVRSAYDNVNRYGPRHRTTPTGQTSAANPARPARQSASRGL